jgi:hypothetical protein
MKPWLSGAVNLAEQITARVRSPKKIMEGIIIQDALPFGWQAVV